MKENELIDTENEAWEAHDERGRRNRELILRAQRGDESAAEALIVENTALVKSIALKFRDRGTEFEDLMQIGTIGMLKAINATVMTAVIAAQAVNSPASIAPTRMFIPFISVVGIYSVSFGMRLAR